MLAAALWLSGTPWLSPAKAADTLLVDGLVRHTEHLTATDLAALPSQHLSIAFQTMQGQEKANYTGVSLWGLLGTAGLAGDLGKRKGRVHHYLVATGSDGYTVVIALGEIDPDLEGKAVLVAYARDGKPLDPTRDGFRLLVPGDHFGARSVRQLAHIEVK